MITYKLAVSIFFMIGRLFPLISVSIEKAKNKFDSLLTYISSSLERLEA